MDRCHGLGFHVGGLALGDVFDREMDHGYANRFLSILIGYSVVMVFAFHVSGKSVLVAILMHSAFNTSGAFGDWFTARPPIDERPSPKWFNAFTFLLVGAVLVLHTRRQLSASRQEALSFRSAVS